MQMTKEAQQRIDLLNEERAQVGLRLLHRISLQNMPACHVKLTGAGREGYLEYQSPAEQRYSCATLDGYSTHTQNTVAH